jgi:hypothetical protein
MKVFKIAVVILLSVMNLAYAETIIFKTNGFHYTLESSVKKISINGYLIDLSFKKKECNKNLITSLHQQIITNLNKKIITEKEYHLITIDNKEYKISKNSDLGKYLFNFPNIVKSNKKKEAFLCRK